MKEVDKKDLTEYLKEFNLEHLIGKCILGYHPIGPKGATYYPGILYKISKWPEYIKLRTVSLGERRIAFERIKDALIKEYK